MNKAKIMLSTKELELVADAGVILTKNNIIHKAKLLLETSQSEMQGYFKKNPASLPQEVTLIPPKISKGENYKGLPYLILDYPRYFNKENIFAIRTMFWWGNFFSSTLHLSGQYKVLHEQKIILSHALLKKEKYFICIEKTEWEHHFERSNFVPIAEFTKSSFQKKINNSSFIKLSQNISLQQWENASEILLDHFTFYNKILTGQLPRR